MNRTIWEVEGYQNNSGTTIAQVGDPRSEEAGRLEKKRQQNTQAARRSRIRKAEEVQKLQNRVAELKAELVATQQCLADAKREAARLDTLHRHEVEFTGFLKNLILNLVGDRKGSEAIGQVTQRWRASVSPSAVSVAHLPREQSPRYIPSGVDARLDMDYRMAPFSEPTESQGENLLGTSRGELRAATALEHIQPVLSSPDPSHLEGEGPSSF